MSNVLDDNGLNSSLNNGLNGGLNSSLNNGLNEDDLSGEPQREFKIAPEKVVNWQKTSATDVKADTTANSTVADNAVTVNETTVADTTTEIKPVFIILGDKLINTRDIDAQTPIRYFNAKKVRVEYKVGEIFHRDEKDGPAIIYPDGSFEYRRYGVLSRRKGPAMAWKAGAKKYLADRMMYNKEGHIEKASKDETKYVEFDRGGYACLVDGKYHCTIAPAMTFDDGEQHWCINGEYHREGDKPTLVRENASSGIKYAYHKNDLLHRGKGRPCVIYHEGAEEWWEYGERIG